jgi:prepilin-type N-terminal cleavage/methylation domain-containing protein
MMRKDQKGFTLVELLIAVAILSVVTAAVAGFIVVGSKTYASANNDITIQQEAQLALNQMSDVMIDTTRSINYAGHRLGSAESQQVLKDSEFTFEPDAKSLTLYNGEAVAVKNADGSTSEDPDIQEGNGNQNYQFYWVKDDETLYYHEIGVKETFPDIDLSDSSAGWEVLAEHVTDFSVDLTQVEEKRVVALELTFEMGNKEYTTSNNVTVRNRILTNDVEIAALDKTVTLSVIPKKSSVILEPGETYHFSTPKVTGKNILDKSVKWTVEGGATAAGSDFTDAANGIIQIAGTESVTSFNVIITTNAKDSDGNPATATVIVYVKRSHDVTMTKTSDSNSENGALEVSAGCEFTISAEATGVKLGVSCDGCGDDVSKDKTVVSAASEIGWKILEGADLVTLTASDDGSATFQMSDTATEGAVIKIRATSWLSAQKGYGKEGSDNGLVTGVIELKVGKNNATQVRIWSEDLRYGYDTPIQGMTAYFRDKSKEYTATSRLVECIRVVNKELGIDRILVHYSTDSGFDIRMAPDLFDLDMNYSYDFYIQILDSISYANLAKGSKTPDDTATIKEEYSTHITSNPADGYTGSRYNVTDVFLMKLDKPMLTFKYQERNFRAQEIYDTVYYSKLGDEIVYDYKPSWFENIFNPDDTGQIDSVRYTIYKGEGDDRSNWVKLYDIDGDILEKQTNKKVLDGALYIQPNGSQFLKVLKKNETLLGTYHIVPGIVYQNKSQHSYEIIWANFDYKSLTYEKRYCELTDSTLHITVTNDLSPAATMQLKTDQYDGGVMFPLPSEKKYSQTFSDSKTTVWKETADSVWVKATDSAKYVELSSVRYMYVPGEDAYYVEPLYQKKINDLYYTEYSCGIYRCASDGSMWERWKDGSAARTFSAATMHIATEKFTGDVLFPLPSDSDYRKYFIDYTGTSWQTTSSAFTVKGHADGTDNNTIKDITFQKVRYRYNSTEKTYYVEPIFEEYVNEIYSIEYSCGVYSCAAKGEKWELDPNQPASKTVINGVNLNITIDGTGYISHFPTPSESGFWFTKNTTGQSYDYWHPTFKYYKTTDTTGSSPITKQFRKVTCDYDAATDTYTVEFMDSLGWGSNGEQFKSYGVYTCTGTGNQWVKQ